MNPNTVGFMALALKPVTIVLLVVAVVLIVGLVVLYRFGSKMQRKSEQSQADLKAGAQNVSLLVIDKKKMKLKEAGLPSVVLEQTPKYLRGAKLPIVKVKIGPRVLNMISDDKLFDLLPLKKEVKAQINGIYIISAKGLRSGLEAPVKKMGPVRRLKARLSKKQDK